MEVPKMLVVGFDAMDRDVATELMEAGQLPNLARLRRDGLTAEMANPIGMLTGPVWATISTGVHPDRHGRLSWRVLRRGTYRMEWLGSYSRPARRPLWRTLADQGVSCLVVDVPTVALEEHPLITQVIDWHLHDRRSEVRSAPATVAEAVVERFGPVEIDLCDEQGAAGELGALRSTLLGEVASFTEGLPWLIHTTGADVVVVVSGASHCAGHQFWHLHDELSHHHDPAARAALGDVLAEVYGALDAALGRFLADVGPDTTTVVVLSHGMGDNTVMPHLIDPIARAIDDAMGPPGRLHWVREALRRTPNRVARLGLRLVGRPLDPLAHIADGSRRFFPVENFPTHGALRLNVVGREPNGRIPPEDVSSVVDRLETELLAVRDADSGEPVVRRVIRLAEHYDHIDTSGLPDVLVEWMGTSIVEGVTSPTIGTIRRPFGQTRTGAHHQDGLAVLHGPGIPAGATTAMRSVDLWPTLAAVLGVDAGDVDGEVLPEVGSSAQV